ncbi:MAG: hypothetical protein ACRDKV_04175 [Solirubrobacterales bacterium]
MPRQLDVAAACCSDRDPECAPAQIGDDPPPRRRQPDLIAAGKCLLSIGDVAADPAQLPGGEAPQAILQRAREQPRCPGQGGVRALAEQQRALGREQVAADLVGRLPGGARGGPGS